MCKKNIVFQPRCNFYMICASEWMRFRRWKHCLEVIKFVLLVLVRSFMLPADGYYIYPYSTKHCLDSLDLSSCPME